MTNSPTDLFTDFLGQLPPILFVLVCVPALLLVVAMVWFAYIKPLRAKRQAQPANSPAPPGPMREPDFVNAPVSSQSARSYDTGELPDLDDLLGGHTLDEEQKPEPESASVEAAPELPPEPETPPPAPQTTPQPVAAVDSAPSGKQRIRLHTGSSVVADEIVSILRDPRDGRLIIQIDGEGYRTLVDTPEVKDEFVKIMKELSGVVAEPDENPPPPDETADEAPEVPGSPPAVEPEQPPPAAPRPSSTPPPPISPDGEMPGDLPRYRLEDSLIPPEKGGLFKKPKYEPAPTPELNIAASIEAYLQHKLQYTPEYAGRSIHVRPAADGSVNIQVDDQMFDSVGEVSDDDIRAFLAETIEEWQDRQ